MKLYLSSYKLGHKTDILKDWIKTNKDNRIALIQNAGDGYGSPPEVIAEKRASHTKLLSDIGFDVTVLDLKEYFGKEKQLIETIKSFRAFWVVGGNTFVLRQAMKLSGFDKFLLSLEDKDGYLYGGWSAGICVLASNLDGLKIVDDPKSNPYNTEIIWQGLGLLDYLPLPHYQSDHPESSDIDKAVAYAQQNGINYKTLRDGEVIVRDSKTNKEKIFTL